MVKLTQEIKDTITMGTVYFFATSSKGGAPNVVPIKALKVMDDETILVSDQYFGKTLKNLEENPKVAIAYWTDKGGYQIKGTAALHRGDKVFEDDVAWVHSFSPKLNPKTAVVIKVSDVFIVKGGPDAGKKIL
ncbi:MAG: Pyridoxamine 5'-phosphate oxidase [Methanocella sp. PtaU1.Bin125]|nr:MAG: Pyridoxamine 5'-phosphate oxidase [Methanocella sp. PtaU1.Bin125]